MSKKEEYVNRVISPARQAVLVPTNTEILNQFRKIPADRRTVDGAFERQASNDPFIHFFIHKI